MFNQRLVKVILAVGLIFFTFLLNAQPVANFSATPQSGCAPLVVNFTDLSSGTPSSWRWDLGNGTISFLQNPSVTYFTPGQYSIKLVVQNAQGRDSITRNQYITVNAQPQVNFSASVLTGCYPLVVPFTDGSIPVSGTITSWQWDFGDGSSSTLQNPTHTYTSSGNYNVSLRVGNSTGCFKTFTRLQYIQINSGVQADFTNNLAVSCTAPATINFTNLSGGTGTLTYNWNFGDGNTSTLANPIHTYLSAGNYTVTLIAINSMGCRDTIIKPNAISIGNVRADFSYPSIICNNTLFRFVNTSTPATVSSTWYFGDGTQSTAISPFKQYALAGTYQVKLVNNFGTCRDSVTKTITVLSKPRAAFTALPVSGCKAPLTVQFTNTSTNGSNYFWLFGDGDSSLFQNPSHTYLNTGMYTVSLVVTNALGCTDTLVRQQYINIALPDLSIDSLYKQGCAPFTWTFTSTLNSTEPAISYLWDFGDGTTSNTFIGSHIYEHAGDYNVSLTVTDNFSCSNTISNIHAVGRTDNLCRTTITVTSTSTSLKVSFGAHLQPHSFVMKSGQEAALQFGLSLGYSLRRPETSDSGPFNIEQDAEVSERPTVD